MPAVDRSRENRQNLCYHRPHADRLTRRCAEVADDEREPLVSLQTVADYLGKTPASIYQLRHRGEFAPGYRVGKTVLFRLSEIDAWLEGRREGSAA
jgi:excisionase family DNA binding protein